jgi:hypothetical protein
LTDAFFYLEEGVFFCPLFLSESQSRISDFRLRHFPIPAKDDWKCRSRFPRKHTALGRAFELHLDLWVITRRNCLLSGNVIE